MDTLTRINQLKITPVLLEAVMEMQSGLPPDVRGSAEARINRVFNFLERHAPRTQTADLVLAVEFRLGFGRLA